MTATATAAELPVEDPLEMVTCNPYRAWLSRRACGMRFLLSQTIQKRPRAGNDAIGKVRVVSSCGLCRECSLGKENEHHGR